VAQVYADPIPERRAAAHAVHQHVVLGEQLGGLGGPLLPALEPGECLVLAFRTSDLDDGDQLAVARAALAEMAVTIDRRQLGATGGLALLEGVGLGYIQFALDEPGWFDVAFFAMGGMVAAAPARSDATIGRSPYRQLEDALARLVDESLLDAARAGDAAIMCWSGVHGFATLTSRGPLRELPRDAIDAQAGRLVADLVAAVVTIR